MPTPFEIADSIITKTQLESIDDYNPYLVNKALSYRRDTIFQAEAMSRYGAVLTNEQQYQFYREAVPRGTKRFVKWGKPEKAQELAVLVSKRYNLNVNRATEMVSMLNQDQKNKLFETFYEGSYNGN
jgi:hypothetical protein